MRKFLLASASPRRRELLGLVLPEFTVQVSAADEDLEERNPRKLVEELAHRKAEAVAREAEKDAVVIGADTVVYAGGEILGKPRDRADARRMLQILSGSTHAVYTGICVIDTETGQVRRDAAKTEVVMAEISKAELEDYLDTEEYADKAGAYGIQGKMARWISGIHGCYYNVMGLPVQKLYALLRDMQLIG